MGYGSRIIAESGLMCYVMKFPAQCEPTLDGPKKTMGFKGLRVIRSMD